MKIFNMLLGVGFFGGVIAAPAGGYLMYGPVDYKNAAAHFTLACKLGAMNWLPNTEATQLLAHDCGCFGEQIVKRLGPAERIRQAETLRSFMIEATISHYRETPYEQIVATPQAEALMSSPVASAELLDWVSYACLAPHA